MSQRIYLSNKFQFAFRFKFLGPYQQKYTPQKFESKSAKNSPEKSTKNSTEIGSTLPELREQLYKVCCARRLVAPLKDRPDHSKRTLLPRLNILHLEASPGWGGQEIRILREAEGMRRRGHEVIFGIMKGGALALEARKRGFCVYELPFQKLYWPFVLPRLLLMMSRHRISLVNTHSSLDSWVGGIAGRLYGIPIVRTRHLSTKIKKGLNSRLLYGFLADRVVTTCAAILPMISLQSGKALSLVRSIPTGVDPEFLEDSRKEGSVQKTEGFLVGTACFMRSWKGINDLLEAANLLRDVPNLRWRIIGGGHEAAYRKKAADLNLEGIVEFTGHLQNPIPAIEELDAFALLSTAHEGVSQAILQAAYLSKPLIATPTGGLSEVCLDEETGIEVPPFSPLDIAKAVLRLMKEPNTCKQFGQKAKELVLSEFTLEKTLNDMEEVYQSCYTLNS